MKKATILFSLLMTLTFAALHLQGFDPDSFTSVSSDERSE